MQRVVKTIKLYIDGKFPRTESGRSFAMMKKGTEQEYARLCQASRKDFRNAMEVAKKARPGWSSRTAYNRAQILYRMAEMMEGKAPEFAHDLIHGLGMMEQEANKEVQAAIDTIVFYAGFCDKYQQVMGAVNPVSGPFHNFTTPDAMGTLVLIEPDNFSLPKLLDDICSMLVGGNSLVVLLSKECPAILAPLAEVFATSDLPDGVVNLLTGDLDELFEHIAAHREVRGLSFQNEREELYFRARELGADSMKRVVPLQKKSKSLDLITNFVEFKTVWHPIGI